MGNITSEIMVSIILDIIEVITIVNKYISNV